MGFAKKKSLFACLTNGCLVISSCKTQPPKMENKEPEKSEVADPKEAQDFKMIEDLSQEEKIALVEEIQSAQALVVVPLTGKTGVGLAAEEQTGWDDWGDMKEGGYESIEETDGSQDEMEKLVMAMGLGAIAGVAGYKGMKAAKNWVAPKVGVDKAGGGSIGKNLTAEKIAKQAQDGKSAQKFFGVKINKKGEYGGFIVDKQGFILKDDKKVARLGVSKNKGETLPKIIVNSNIGDVNLEALAKALGLKKFVVKFEGGSKSDLQKWRGDSNDGKWILNCRRGLPFNIFGSGCFGIYTAP
jgi:hypothetical protein